MSSIEPPSRSQRGQSHETKAAREQLENKGYVEKVREVDPDEQTRKERFSKFYNTEPIEEKEEKPSHPSPFDLCARKEPTQNGANPFSEAADLGDMDNAVIPSPGYTTPPDVNAQGSSDEDEGEDPLPQSDGFWQGRDNADFPPDEPQAPQQMIEGGSSQSSQPHNQRTSQTSSKKTGAHPSSLAKKGEVPTFGPQGMKKDHEPKIGAQKEKGPEKKKLPTPFEAAASVSSNGIKAKDKDDKLPKTVKLRQKEEKDDLDNAQYAGPISLAKEHDEKGGGGEKRDKDRQTIEIESMSTPPLPAKAIPIATNATMQAAPYLNETTSALFFQMVGTMHMMTGPQGVNRTEIMLNNPAFAGSKFFGATIKIEKYATAPDSFNITLSGSNDAVLSFKENMPSLMEAFQNGNFTFKVNRLDVEYATEKPLFRRKERGDDKGGDTSGEKR